MLVNSAIELYTMLLAWHLYDGFWSILSGTGIGVIPFVAVIINTLLDFQEKENVGSKQFIRVLEVRLYTMLFVFFIAVTPFVDLQLENTQYIEATCPSDDSSAPATHTKSFGDSGTTLDSDGHFIAMLGGDHVPKAPLWWYVFSRLNVAIPNSLKFELPCRADLVTVTANLAGASITDPNLRAEAAHFNNQCWLPASNKFLANRVTDADVLTEFRPIVDNVSWFGSKYYMDTPGYYDTFRTDVGLRNFTYSRLEGEDVVSDGADELGWPTCKKWWSDSDDGLRKRLLDDIKNGSMKGKMDSWNDVAPTFFDSSTDATNQLLKTAITAPGKQSPQSKLPIANSHINGGWFSTEGWVNGAAGVGVLYEGASALLEAQALKAGAPVIQAFVLMMFVIVLPLLMFLSLYDIANLVTLTVVQFSVMFWSFLFALALWLNNFLLSALFGDHWFDILNTGDQPMEMLVTMWIVKFAYVGLPLIFSAMLSVVGRNMGLRIEQGLTGMMHGAGGGATSGAKKLGNIAKKRK